MTQELLPGISALAHEHRVGTPIKRYDYSVLVVVAWVLIGIFLLSEILYLLAVLSHPGHFTPAQVINSQGPDLILFGVGIFSLWRLRASYFYLCSAGFLELKRGKALTVKHALRWDDVRSTRRTLRGYYITNKQGVEIRISNKAIWDRCNQQAKSKKTSQQAKGKKTQKRA